MDLDMTPELAALLDDLEACLADGEKVDISALQQEYPEHADALWEHFVLLSLTSLPRPAHEEAQVPERELAAWQETDWNQLIETTARAWSVEASSWKRLQRAIPQVLEDLAGFSVSRDGRPVFFRNVTARSASTRSHAYPILSEPGLVRLRPLRRGDLLNITCTAPRAGALMMLRILHGQLTILYPTQRKQVRHLLPGAREELSLEVSGDIGEFEMLIVLSLPEVIAASGVMSGVDALISSLAGRPDVAMRGYRFRVE